MAGERESVKRYDGLEDNKQEEHADESEEYPPDMKRKERRRPLACGWFIILYLNRADLRVSLTRAGFATQNIIFFGRRVRIDVGKVWSGTKNDES